MANMVRVRVEVSHREEDSYVAFKRMFAAFRGECIDAGIQRDYRRHETYESKSQKKRRKRKESDIMKLKAKLKENFISKQGKK